MSDKKVALITGGAGGIGVATGEVLAREGWQVVLTDSDQAGLDAAVGRIGNGAQSIAFDLRDVEAIRAGVAEVAARFGRLDGLVNNAGVFKLEPLLDVQESTYDLLMDVNVKGAFFCLQAAGAEMARRKNGGVIVNVASAAGRSGRITQSVYGMSKAALIHLTKSAAISFAEHQVRVCCVCPAAVDTPMMAKNFAERRAVAGDADVNRFMDTLLVKRLCAPEEVAELIGYLMSEKAAYITGGSIDISGGLDMH